VLKLRNWVAFVGWIPKAFWGFSFGLVWERSRER
jgi:hypothetical protein